MGFVAEDLSTTYHERYQWCTAYLNGLFDLKTNPERYISFDVWEEHFDLMVSTGAQDERAKRAYPLKSGYGFDLARKFTKTDTYQLLRNNVTMRGNYPLSDELHAVLVHRIVTFLLTYVDRDGFAYLAYHHTERN